jgi:hypothetical protein
MKKYECHCISIGEEMLHDVYLASDVERNLGASLQLLECVKQRDDRIAELDKALREAIDDIESWAGYASDYFQEKHDLAGGLARLRSVLTEGDSR